MDLLPAPVVAAERALVRHASERVAQALVADARSLEAVADDVGAVAARLRAAAAVGWSSRAAGLFRSRLEELAAGVDAAATRTRDVARALRTHAHAVGGS